MRCSQKSKTLCFCAQKNVLLLILFVLTIAIAGCSAAPYRINPITRDCQENAVIPGIPGARYWGDQPPLGVERWLESPVADIKRDYPAIFGKPHNYLALSAMIH